MTENFNELIELVEFDSNFFKKKLSRLSAID